ncbi:MAG: peptidylprolyl isomerase [Clostridia bacterium]|nr:peptidylprolyl isomerase [Clostridia bacterium]
MMMKRFAALVLALLLACGAALAQTAPTQEPATTTAPTPVPVDPNAIVLKVGEKTFTQAELDEYELTAAYAYYGTTANADDPAITALAMDMMITEYFVETKKAELNITLTDEEVAELEKQLNEEIQLVANQLLQYGYAAAEADALTMAQELANQEGYNLDMLKKTLESEKVVAELTKDLVVTDEEIKTFYDERVASDTQSYTGENGLSNYALMEMYYKYGYLESFRPYYIPEGIRVINHILLMADEATQTEYQNLLASLEEAEDAADKAAEGETVEADEDAAAPVTVADKEAMEAAIIASKQETITEIMTKLDNGASFIDLVSEYSDDTGASAEGYQVHKEASFVDAFRIGAFELLEKVGDVSVPVVSEYGVHILYYQGDVTPGPIQLDDALKAEISAGLRDEKESTSLSEQLEAWKQAVGIETYEGYTLD